jgi:AcrR family transcriptional regulator
MKAIKSSTGRNEKLKIIIEASQKRFGLYGVDKTSMREIASDLNISKASLYYYFPDKESLYQAVLEKEQTEFISNISERISSLDDPEQLLREYAEARLSYFRTLLNLSRLRLEVYAGIKHDLKNTIQIFKEKEKEMIIRIFERGISRGIFFIDNKEQAAFLFLDMLKGIRVSTLYEKQTFFIEKEEYDLLYKKTVAFANIFIKGIKYLQTI